MVFIIPHFLVLLFGGNFMKIRAKIAKLQIHENLHKNVNENMLSFTFLYKFSCILWSAIKAANMSQQSFILLILIYLNWQSSSFRQYQFFPIWMVWMFFSQIQQASGPISRIVGKSLYSLGTRCPCTLKQLLLSKITYINTLSDLLSK